MSFRVTEFLSSSCPQQAFIASWTLHHAPPSSPNPNAWLQARQPRIDGQLSAGSLTWLTEHPAPTSLLEQRQSHKARRPFWQEERESKESAECSHQASPCPNTQCCSRARVLACYTSLGNTITFPSGWNILTYLIWCGLIDKSEQYRML